MTTLLSHRRSLVIIAVALTLAGLGMGLTRGPSTPPGMNPNAERMKQLMDQLTRAEDELAQAQLVSDFWDKESQTQESLMAQYAPLTQTDPIAPTLMERAKQLTYRCGYQAQDARLRLAQTLQRVQILRASVAAGQ